MRHSKESSEKKSNGVKIAVYPGSFDPLTNGHLDIIRRGLNLFDRVIVAVVRKPVKKPSFSVEERLKMASQVFKNWERVEVDDFDGLLVDYLKKKSARIVLRGLRAISDFEYEFQLALMNRKLARDIETVFLMPAEQYCYLSSSIVKEIVTSGGQVDDLVPQAVKEVLEKLR